MGFKPVDEVEMVVTMGALMFVAGLLGVMKGLFEVDIYAAIIGTILAVMGAVITAAAVVSRAIVYAVGEKYEKRSEGETA